MFCSLERDEISLEGELSFSFFFERVRVSLSIELSFFLFI